MSSFPGPSGPSALGGAAGSHVVGITPLSIGGVTFFSDECPDDIPLGAAEQMVAVHQLVGGGRVVQAFGVNPPEVAWSGKLFDANVALRVQQLRLYAVAGTEVTLSWGSEQYRCLVKRFAPKFKGGYAEYDIAVVITRDRNGAFTVTSPQSIDQQVAALQAQATTQNAAIVSADPTGSSAFQGDLSTVNASIQSNSPIGQNIATAGPAISSATSTATTSVQTYQNTLSPSASWLPNVMLLVSSLQSISANVKRGQAPKTILRQGGNLFKVAAQEYGDVSLAFSLASANGMPSPFLSGTKATQFVLPPFRSGN